jgi:hypothetical protein
MCQCPSENDPGHWVSSGHEAPVFWLAGSRDLNPIDFFFVGIFKNQDPYKYIQYWKGTVKTN